MNHATDYTLKINYLTIVGFLGREVFLISWVGIIGFGWVRLHPDLL
jgi:hypothetical protein